MGVSWVSFDIRPVRLSNGPPAVEGNFSDAQAIFCQPRCRTKPLRGAFGAVIPRAFLNFFSAYLEEVFPESRWCMSALHHKSFRN